MSDRTVRLAAVRSPGLIPHPSRDLSPVLTPALTLSAILLLCAALPAAAAVEGDSGWDRLEAEASAMGGTESLEAAAFLRAHQPERDATLDAELLLENLRYALRARTEFPWAARVEDALFLNDVLPYAVLDEQRERWRPTLHTLASEIVAGSSTAAEAAHALNRELFGRAGVRYSTSRRAPNQGPLESMQSGTASCTGLSIMLVSACRAVGIPARVAGVASWPERGGNHTWVEIHDGERWRFAGAAEPDEHGLDRAWFAAEAAQAVEGSELHGIWASCWRHTGHHYPLPWSPTDRTVAAIEVTDRYHADVDALSTDPAPARMIATRLWASRGGLRMVARVTLVAGERRHEATTYADPDDINRVAEFPAEMAEAGGPLRAEVTVIDANGVERTRIAWLDGSQPDRAQLVGRLVELHWDELALSASEATREAERQWTQRRAAMRSERQPELDAKTIRCGADELRFLRRDFGDAPEGGRSLWISMHGGGGAPSAVNDQQWANQIRLYEPEEGIVVAPRAPSNEWNLWHRPEIDRLFARLIESAIVGWDVNPDRVYLLGYSAGGDGVYQLAPRMADRFAAAAMMAGHPNDASPRGLRNLPFAIFMGGKDSAYGRNEVARAWGDRLAALRDADSDGYTHFVRIYPDHGHWMQGEDREALPWMASFTRNPWPRRVVWQQGNVPHTRFAWLGVDAEHAVSGRVISASVDGQTIQLAAEPAPAVGDSTTWPVQLLLSDALLDLDEPIRVLDRDRVVFEGRAVRCEQSIRRSLDARADPRMIATATVEVTVRSEE